MLIKAGSTLLVPRGNALLADVSSEVADNATLALAPEAPPLRKISLKAGNKDSVASVAKRYRVSAAQVAAVEHGRRRARASRRGRRSSSTSPRRAARARGRGSQTAPARPRGSGRDAQRGSASSASTARRRDAGKATELRRRRRQALSRSRRGAERGALSAGRRSAWAIVPEVDVFELAADRHAARQPRDAHAARLQRLAEHVRRRLALGGEVGREDDLLDRRRRRRARAAARAPISAGRCRRAG